MLENFQAIALNQCLTPPIPGARCHGPYAFSVAARLLLSRMMLSFYYALLFPSIHSLKSFQSAFSPAAVPSGPGYSFPRSPVSVSSGPKIPPSGFASSHTFTFLALSDGIRRSALYMRYLGLDRDSSSCHELVIPQKGKQKCEIYTVATSFLMYRIDTQGAYFKVATPLVVKSNNFVGHSSNCFYSDPLISDWYAFCQFFPATYHLTSCRTS